MKKKKNKKNKQKKPHTDLKEHHKFLQFPQNLFVTLRCAGFLKEKQLCEKLILKTRVKVSLQLLGSYTNVSAMANFKGTYAQVHFFVVEKVEKRKIMKLLDSISELISNIDIPKI